MLNHHITETAAAVALVMVRFSGHMIIISVILF